MATTKVSVPTERKTPKWVIVLTFIGAAVLLIVGVLVLLAGREMWQHPGSPQVSHPTKATLEVVKMPVKVVKKHGQTHRSLGPGKQERRAEGWGRGGGRESHAPHWSRSTTRNCRRRRRPLYRGFPTKPRPRPDRARAPGGER